MISGSVPESLRKGVRRLWLLFLQVRSISLSFLLDTHSTKAQLLKGKSNSFREVIHVYM